MTLHNGIAFRFLVRFGLVLLFTLNTADAWSDDPSDFEQAKQNLLRSGRLRMRENNLPGKLHNDELFLENHTLDNKLALLNGKPKDVDFDRILVDRTLIAIDRKTIAANQRLIQILVTGSSAQQNRTNPIESNFDGAIKACHPKDSDDFEPYRNAEEVKKDCDQLRKIIADVFAIVPTVSPRPASLIVHLPGSMGEKLLREDKGLFASDRRLPCGGDEKEKRNLLQNDDTIIKMDRMIWITEISQSEIVAFNSKFPKHMMADLADVVSHILEFRDKLAKLNSPVRTDCLQP